MANSRDNGNFFIWGENEVKFRVDTRLVTEILSRGQYSQIKSIISEYVANAWDADATYVSITIPEDFTCDPIIIEDNGDGIDLSIFSVVAVNKQKDNRKRTKSNRPVIGSKGIGRWSGFAFADKLHFETRRDKKRYYFSLDKTELSSHESLSEYECNVNEDICGLPSGTIVTLVSSQRMSNPSPESIKEELLLEFGYSKDFSICVNGKMLEQEDLPGQKHIIDDYIPLIGKITGYINVTNWPIKKTEPGVIIRVSGRRVVGPDFFGIEQDFTKKVINRIRGEISADGLADIITSNREAFIEYDEKYIILKEWLQNRLYSIASDIQDEENIDIASEILKIPAVKLGYDQLPPYLRNDYTIQLKRFATKLGRVRKDKELLTLFGLLLLRALESVDFQAILMRLNDTDSRDVAELAKVLREWGFGEIARASNLIQERLKVLHRFAELVEDDKSLELSHIHSVLESNTWILEERFDLFMSNQSLKATAEKLGGTINNGNRKKRPDLILKRGIKDFILIELKRPKEIIDLSHAAQVLEYKAELSKVFPEMRDLDIYLVGRQYKESVKLSYAEGNSQKLHLLSLKEIVQNAHDRLKWLSIQLKEQCDNAPEFSDILAAVPD